MGRGRGGGQEWQLWFEEKPDTDNRRQRPATTEKNATRPRRGAPRPRDLSLADQQRCTGRLAIKVQQGVVQLVWESHPLKNSASVSSEPRGKGRSGKSGGQGQERERGGGACVCVCVCVCCLPRRRRPPARAAHQVGDERDQGGGGGRRGGGGGRGVRVDRLGGGFGQRINSVALLVVLGVCARGSVLDWGQVQDQAVRAGCVRAAARVCGGESARSVCDLDSLGRVSGQPILSRVACGGLLVDNDVRRGRRAEVRGKIVHLRLSGTRRGVVLLCHVVVWGVLLVRCGGVVFCVRACGLWWRRRRRR